MESQHRLPGSAVPEWVVGILLRMSNSSSFSSRHFPACSPKGRELGASSWAQRRTGESPRGGNRGGVPAGVSTAPLLGRQAGAGGSRVFAAAQSRRACKPPPWLRPNGSLRAPGEGAGQETAWRPVVRLSVAPQKPRLSTRVRAAAARDLGRQPRWGRPLVTWIQTRPWRFQLARRGAGHWGHGGVRLQGPGLQSNACQERRRFFSVRFRYSPVK